MVKVHNCTETSGVPKENKVGGKFKVHLGNNYSIIVFVSPIGRHLLTQFT